MGEHDEQFIFEMGYNKGFKDGIKGSIPKSDYETRLKADLVAMLEDLKQDIISEAYGIETDCSDYVVNVADIDKVIQQKIREVTEDGKTD